jgi:V8-like Glu-specific endopeptidase
VKDYSQYPYSSIGLITCYLGDQKVIGSGCLIGPNHVLTSAHNLWSFKDKKIGKNITFTPMFNSSHESVTFQTRKVHLAE